MNGGIIICSCRVLKYLWFTPQGGPKRLHVQKNKSWKGEKFSFYNSIIGERGFNPSSPTKG